VPLVSVIVPTHNRPEMLSEALASVRAQTFVDYEIIVVSNGETPENRGLSEEAAALADARYFRLEEGNLSAARNFGVERAQGEWIGFLDDDDIWLPHKLEREIAEADRSRADMITCDFIRFYADGREEVLRPRLLPEWTYTKAVNHLEWWAQPSCVLVRKAAVERVGGFDSKQRMIEDTELWRRISWRHSIHQMDEVLMRYRCGHASLMGNVRRYRLYELRYFLKAQLDTPRDLRDSLPNLWDVAAWRVAELTLPKFIRQPFHPDRLRRRWKSLTRWMTPAL
jgi:glycosyltransferase involved in cell wall biosynthesis